MEVVMAGPITEIMRVISIMGIGIMEMIIEDIDIMDTEIGHHQGYRHCGMTEEVITKV